MAIMAATGTIDPIGGLSRRRLLCLLTVPALAGVASPAHALQGELTARPSGVPPADPPAHGLRRLGDLGVLYIPSTMPVGRPAPLLLALHGAGQGGGPLAQGLLPLADELGLVLLAPDSAGRTWDWLDPIRQQGGSRVRPGMGPDLGRINRALAEVFTLLPIDAARIALMGFSDGATFGLDLGIRNPDLFARLFLVAPSTIPKITRGPGAEIHIIHGTGDRVLPEKATAEVTVPALRRRGFTVTYEPFEGGHTIPLPLLRRAMGAWLG
ncbi:alpha/beta hydrolase [Niveispirillum sp. KHB5.9]|uniref:alpha/beta hydrolase n=1 Tax=Niveispirillum sp. KHB5.9 TaxID=3400269 RepID=UPI003A86DC3B